MNGAVLKALSSIAEDILTLVHLILDENGLQSSALKEDARCTVEASDNLLIQVLFNNYVYYIENGRKPNATTPPPISELREWALRKGLPTTNDVLFAVAESIRKQGVAPRPILAQLEEQIELSFDNEWADQLFDAIVEELEVYFK